MRHNIAVVGNDKMLQTYIKKKYPTGTFYTVSHNCFFKNNSDILTNGKTNIFFISRPFDLLPSTRSYLTCAYIGNDIKSKIVYENYGGSLPNYNTFCKHMNLLEWYECLYIDFRVYINRHRSYFAQLNAINISLINIGMIYCIHHVESNYRNVDVNLYKLISSFKTD